MKKWLDCIWAGYLIQITFIIIPLALAGLLWQFLDNFYNQWILGWILGRKIAGLGFLLSLVLALILGLITETKGGWGFISRYLDRIPLARDVVDLVKKWKIFRELAGKHGVILAPYYRKASAFAPGVVTNVIPEENGRYLITVVFGDIPIPKPLILTEEDIVLVHLTFKEALSFMLSGGLALRIFERRLRRLTLGNYVRLHPGLLNPSAEE